MRRMLALALLVATAVLSGCDVIGGIFKAGMWVGIVLVVVVVAGLLWLIRKLRR